MKSSCCPVTTSIAIGVAAGAIGACVMLLMRQFDLAYAHKTIPHTRNDTPPHMDPVTRQPIPTHSITAAPQPIVAPLVCGAIAARDFEMPFEEDYKGIAQLGRDTEETPIDVPLHPGAERWFREHTQG